MQPTSFADVVGANATVQIAPGSKANARFLKLAVVSAGSVVVRIGDSSVSATQGVALISNPAAGIASPVLDLELDGGDVTEYFPMNSIYAYVPTGATLTITSFS
jgi:hypothetical protein